MTPQGSMTPKIIYTVLGAVFGGMMGYLVTDLILWKIEERQFLEELQAEDEVVLLKKEGETKKPTDYSGQYNKPSLDSLVSMYRGDGILPDKPDIYPISREEWESFDSVREKEGITYYEVDGVFVRSDNEPLEENEVKNLIGVEAEKFFDSVEMDFEDTVLIRNVRLGIDFEITKLEMSYEDVMADIEEDEDEPPMSAAKQKFAVPERKKKAYIPPPEEDEDDAE